MPYPDRLIFSQFPDQPFLSTIPRLPFLFYCSQTTRFFSIVPRPPHPLYYSQTTPSSLLTPDHPHLFYSSQITPPPPPLYKPSSLQAILFLTGSQDTPSSLCHPSGPLSHQTCANSCQLMAAQGLCICLDIFKETFTPLAVCYGPDTWNIM